MSVDTINTNYIGDEEDTSSRVTVEDLFRQIEAKGRQEKIKNPNLTSEIDAIIRSLRDQVPQVLDDSDWKALSHFNKQVAKMGHTATQMHKSDGKPERRQDARDQKYTTENRQKMLQESRERQKGNVTY